MVKKAKSISLESETIELIENLPLPYINGTGPVNNFSSKIEVIVNDFSKMISNTKRELARRFTEKEIYLIINCFTSTMITTNISAKHFLNMSVSDSITFEGSDALYQVDKDVILGKINELTEFQSYIVMTMAYEALNQNKAGSDFGKIIKRVFFQKETKKLVNFSPGLYAEIDDKAE